MTEDQNTKTVSAGDTELETSTEYNLARGQYAVRLNPDAAQLPSRAVAWLPAAQARQLARDLFAQADEADKHNGTDDPDTAVAAVRAFLADELSRDDMTLAEIAAKVVRIARGEG